MRVNFDSYYDPPDYPDYPCEICGEHFDDCICPVCPVCDEVGDPACYRNHGMKRNEEQKFNLEIRQREWAEECEAENRYWDEMAKEAEKYEYRNR